MEGFYQAKGFYQSLRFLSTKRFEVSPLSITHKVELFSVHPLENETQTEVEIFSVHSISKGYYGECGIRAGYLHTTNVDPEVCLRFLWEDPKRCPRCLC